MHLNEYAKTIICSGCGFRLERHSVKNRMCKNDIKCFPKMNLLRWINFCPISNVCPLRTPLQHRRGRYRQVHSTRWKMLPWFVLRIYKSSLTFDWFQNVKRIFHKTISWVAEVEDNRNFINHKNIDQYKRGLHVTNELDSYRVHIVSTKFSVFLVKSGFSLCSLNSSNSL